MLPQRCSVSDAARLALTALLGATLSFPDAETVDSRPTHLPSTQKLGKATIHDYAHFLNLNNVFFLIT